MRTELVNLVLFTERAQALLAGLVVEIGTTSRSDLRAHALTEYMAPETLADLAKGSPRYVIDVEIKTSRVKADYGEHGYDGPADPSKAAKTAAQALADEYGMYFIYSPIESSAWGSFRFEGKVAS
jgi:hypothetical protein